MKRSDIEALQDELTGGNATSPNGHNLVGALNAILNTYDDADQWGATPGDDDWSEAHEDFQYLRRRVINLLNDLDPDDALEDDEGAVLAELPNAATASDQTADIPSPPDQ